MLRYNQYDIWNSMNRTYYVDAVNGDDNNEGTESAPFKTIKKAIESSPLGGNIEIIFLSDYTYYTSQEGTITHTGFLMFDGNNHHIIFYQDNSDIVILLDTHNLYFLLQYANVDFICNSSAVFNTVINNNFGKIRFYNTVITFQNNSNYDKWLLQFSGKYFFQDTTIKLDLTTTNKSGLLNLAGQSTADLWIWSTSLEDTAGNLLSWKDNIANIVYDANGVPRNIVSNIIF